MTPPVVAKVNQLNDIAKKRGQSLAQMALTWTLRPQEGTAVTSALIGASRPAQIIENVRFADAPALSDEELKSIESILAL